MQKFIMNSFCRPRTLIESAATANHQLGNPKLWRKVRRTSFSFLFRGIAFTAFPIPLLHQADILSDAILSIASEDPHTFTNQMLLDEPYLRSKGVTDFAKYQCVPGHEPPTMEQIKAMVMGAGDKSTASKKN